MNGQLEIQRQKWTRRILIGLFCVVITWAISLWIEYENLRHRAEAKKQFVDLTLSDLHNDPRFNQIGLNTNYRLSISVTGLVTSAKEKEVLNDIILRNKKIFYAFVNIDVIVVTNWNK